MIFLKYKIHVCLQWREREREREREITLRNQLLTVYFSSPISALKYLLYHVRTLFENFLSYVYSR